MIPAPANKWSRYAAHCCDCTKLCSRWSAATTDSQFSWLHNISEFVVRLDEALTGKAPIGPADAETAFDLARKMFTPTESGDAFQKQYFAAIQRDPAVVMEHAELARLFSQTLPKEKKE